MNQSRAAISRKGSEWGDRLFLIIGRSSTLMSILFMALLLAGAIGAPFVARYSPYEMIIGSELLPPSLDHPFGTDEYGRDLLSRTLFGLRVSFVAAGSSTLLAGAIGVALGLIAGYCAGLLDTIIMRIVDGLLAIPALLMGFAIVAILGPGLSNVTITLAIIQLPVFARLARGTTLAEKQKEYVTAAVAIGASPVRVMTRHILLNCMPSLLVQAALALGFSVLIEASLSFLGLGIKPPEPSLGSILDASRSKMRHALWYPLFPGVTLTLLLFALNGLADMLNDTLISHHR
ncbi:MAG: ABC transporter permease [Thermoproteota archaeon]